MTRPPASVGGAQRKRCPRCHGPVLRQQVGQRAAVDVIADAEQMTAADAEKLRGPNRLHWCLRTTRRGLDLQWASCRTRSAPCPHPHVVDHVCTGPPAPVRTAARSRRPTPAAGQLTL